MIAVLNKQRVQKRKIAVKHSKPRQIRFQKAEKLSQKEKKVRFIALVRDKGIIDPFYVLLAGFILIAVLLYYNSVNQDIQQKTILPKDNSVESLLLKALIPEASFGSNKSTPIPKEVLAGLKIVKYRVKRGDTLSGIAGKFGVRLGTIISYNSIKDARLLKAGQFLEIPNRDGLKYRVRRGDSLSRIAKAYNVSLNKIVDYNNLKSSVIQPGQELFIVGAKMRTNDLNRVLGKLFIYPTHGRITSRFGMRHDPFTGIMRFHNGVDLANRVGTKIVAAMAGIVARTGINPTYGKYIIIRHPDGYQTLYAHLSKILVSRGKRVNQNQLIGKMGNTGYSTGSHLHFSIFKNGEPVDPLKYLH